ncbi:MAG: T9SS type A sorting domain-containing protein [Bacteroidetes bacterium]|nr:T9SS type A sorting domain-containing protein [Bacteroidota bacterium]MCL2302385.1 T9SS type A sorting domain-containing protein [Lentimicrobiaceae bacterium]
MKKIILLIISIFITAPLCVCQTSKKELPTSFLYNLSTRVEQYNLNAQLTRVGNETRTEVIEGDTLDFSDPIIGELFSVYINKNNTGTWTAMDNGDSIWQLQINSTAGNYMMLLFDNFYIPRGAKLFVYATDKSQTYGPFTDENNYPSRKFSIAPLKTNSLIIEYYKPFYVREQAALNIRSVGLIGNSLEQKSYDGFGTSDPCMINAMCPEYADWCNQRRSVALQIMVFPNSDSTARRASGSLLTNEKRDGKPFLLTAFHCLDRNNDGEIDQSEKDDLEYWVFVFNYQSPNCSNPIIEPSYEYFISGAVFLRGRSYYPQSPYKTGSDYALLQLKRKPPKNYNVYYNGWSNDADDITETGVGIHHPQRDIKKIAVWEKIASANIAWRGRFTEGGIQEGSSGSPLFNSSGYVMGQLMSGNVFNACGKKSRGTYGRFDKSWHNYGLHYELNPSGTNSGGNGVNLISMSGDETCKQNWHFNNCDDLHTSANVGVVLTPSIRQYDGVYNAKDFITAKNTTIQSGTKVVFEAGNKIVLKPGFHAKAGSTFIAKIDDCELGCYNGKGRSEDEPKMVFSNSDSEIIKTNVNNINAIGNDAVIRELTIYPNPNNGTFSIKLSNKNSEFVKITITDIGGTIIYNTDTFTERVQLSNPPAGIYIISLIFKDKVLTSKFAVL